MLVAIVHTRNFKKYFFLQASALFNTKIFTHWSTLRFDLFVFLCVDTLYACTMFCQFRTNAYYERMKGAKCTLLWICIFHVNLYVDGSIFILQNHHPPCRIITPHIAESSPPHHPDMSIKPNKMDSRNLDQIDAWPFQIPIVHFIGFLCSCLGNIHGGFLCSCLGHWLYMGGDECTIERYCHLYIFSSTSYLLKGKTENNYLYLFLKNVIQAFYFGKSFIYFQNDRRVIKSFKFYIVTNVLLTTKKMCWQISTGILTRIAEYHP